MTCGADNFLGMPRQARLDAPGALLHVIVGGIKRRKIFTDNVAKKIRSKSQVN